MDRKTTQLIEALKRAPMKASHARALASRAQFAKLVERGCITKYQDINPEYAQSTGGQKPICQWVKLGAVEYVEPYWGGKKGGVRDSSNLSVRIEKAVELLTAYGYSILPPNAQDYGRWQASRGVSPG
jgi:hypothetical protein